ncbi:MAG: cyanophycinase [Planctomycetaceae bacterium]
MRNQQSTSTRQGRAIQVGVLTTCSAVLGLALRAGLSADEPASPAPPLLAPNYATGPGSLFICGGGKLSEPMLSRFVQLAGGNQARLVIITTASEFADAPDIDARLGYWRRLPHAEFTILHTRDRDTADDPEFSKSLARATGVWFTGGHQDRLIDAYRGTAVEQAVHKVLERGGAVGGTSAGAAVMSPVMILGGNTRAQVGPGFGFVPGTVIDQHFLKRRREERLQGVLRDNPDLVGLGIDEHAAVIITGRRLEVVRESESQAIVCLAPLEDHPPRRMVLEAGDELDLVAWRRAAASRTRQRSRFDAPEAVADGIKGTLVLVGGGKTPVEAADRFIKGAGGVDAPIVVVTTAAGDQPPPQPEATAWLSAAGAKKVTRIHPRTPAEADDPALLALLTQAGGVWFTGGRQWRLVDAFLDTAAEKLLHKLLARGGAIGGSAAGASIQASFLVRGNPLSNKPVMAEGYEDGFGFLPGAAVDPFFSSRNRFPDMASLKAAHPDLVGVGLDEDTALVVHGNDVEVVGQHQACVYDRQRSQDEAQPRFDRLYAGDRYDLAARKRLGPLRDDPQEFELAVRPQGPAEDAEDSEGETPSEPQPQPALTCE